MRRFFIALLALSFAAGTASSQGDNAPAAQDDHGASGDFITPHITDGNHLEIPYWKPPFHKEITLPSWPPVHLGSLTLDFSPTKHLIFMALAALLCILTLTTAARAHQRQTKAEGSPRGFAAAIESVVLYLRNEVILPNVGPHGEKFVPFCLTLFFFILYCNLIGLVPYGATPTGNVAVTGMLAIIAFFVIEIAGMRALGWGYLGTIFYWPHDMPFAMKAPMTLIMTPIELLGKFAKIFALAIRLFANMTGGHIVVLALIGLIFTFSSYLIAPLPVAMTVAIMMLELFVAFLQAFVFTLLVSVFIGQMRVAQH
jgi:F-type H+-transporting ATPase subunit a